MFFTLFLLQPYSLIHRTIIPHSVHPLGSNTCPFIIPLFAQNTTQKPPTYRLLNRNIFPSHANTPFVSTQYPTARVRTPSKTSLAADTAAASSSSVSFVFEHRNIQVSSCPHLELQTNTHSAHHTTRFALHRARLATRVWRS